MLIYYYCFLSNIQSYFVLLRISPHFTTVIKIRHQYSREYIKHDYLRCLAIHNGQILTYFICDFLNVVILIQLTVYVNTKKLCRMDYLNIIFIDADTDTFF